MSPDTIHALYRTYQKDYLLQVIGDPESEWEPFQKDALTDRLVILEKEEEEDTREVAVKLLVLEFLEIFELDRYDIRAELSYIGNRTKKQPLSDRLELNFLTRTFEWSFRVPDFMLESDMDFEIILSFYERGVESKIEQVTISKNRFFPSLKSANQRFRVRSETQFYVDLCLSVPDGPETGKAGTRGASEIEKLDLSVSNLLLKLSYLKNLE